MGFWLFELVYVAVLRSLTIGLGLAERISHVQQKLGLRKVEKTAARDFEVLVRGGRLALL